IDLTQPRLAPPDGVLMHWSRLVDGPIALGIKIAERVAGPERAEALALIGWPLLLLLGFVAASVRAATALGGRDCAFPAAVLAILCLDALIYFIPGRLDHHNVQLALIATAVGGILSLRTGIAGGVMAGLALAASVAIGMETVPYLPVIAGYAALRWAFIRPDGAKTDSAIAAFGLFFALGLIAAYDLSIPWDATPVCDAFSQAYLLPGVLGGVGLSAAVVLAKNWKPRERLASLVSLGMAAGGLILFTFPECLSGPFWNMSPELKRLWLDSIAETQGILAYGAVEPVAAIGKIGAPVLALTLALCQAAMRFRKRQAVGDWVFVAALILLALSISAVHVRATPFANALAIPVLAVWIADMRVRTNGRLGLNPAAALLAAWLFATPLAYYGIGSIGVAFGRVALPMLASKSATNRPGILTGSLTGLKRECADRASAAALAALPTGRLLSPVFYGPNVLVSSPHAVLSGPYHRAEQAILDTIRAFNGTQLMARVIVERHAIDYIVVCPTSDEVKLTAAEAPGSFLNLLLTSQPIRWLEPVATPAATPLMIFAVRPDNADDRFRSESKS
ncbi:MAG TPA: hypothetical protein VLA28_03950, partial [Afifellaceae bacterium]|nr:hypothetical protein [Afifellaceae bacterium]